MASRPLTLATVAEHGPTPHRGGAPLHVLLQLPLLRLFRLWELPWGVPSKSRVSVFTTAAPDSGSGTSSDAVGLLPPGAETAGMLAGARLTRLLAFLLLPEEVSARVDEEEWFPL